MQGLGGLPRLFCTRRFDGAFIFCPTKYHFLYDRFGACIHFWHSQWNRGCKSREVPGLCLVYFFDKAGAEDVIEQLRPITCEVMPQPLLATGYRKKIAIKLLIRTPVELHLRESLIVGQRGGRSTRFRRPSRRSRAEWRAARDSPCTSQASQTTCSSQSPIQQLSSVVMPSRVLETLQCAISLWA
jgi:hypothetical protein